MLSAVSQEWYRLAEQNTHFQHLLQGGVGFTAIIVAWLANLNPFGILVVSFLFAVLEKGSTVVSSEFVLSPYCSDVLQGIILFFVLGCEFFIRYRFVTRGGRKND